MVRYLLPLALALPLLPVHAQQEEHPIEQGLGRCIDRDGTMWLLNMAGARLDLLRRRVQDLIDYRDSLFLDH